MKSKIKQLFLNSVLPLCSMLLLIQCKETNKQGSSGETIDDRCKERLKLNPIIIDMEAFRKLIAPNVSYKTDRISAETKDRLITEYQRRRNIINNRSPQGFPGSRNYLYNDSTNYVTFNVFKILYEMANLKNKSIDQMTLEDWENIKLGVHFGNYGSNPPQQVGASGEHQNTIVIEISTSNQNSPDVTPPAATFINLGDLCPPCPDGGD